MNLNAHDGSQIAPSTPHDSQHIDNARSPESKFRDALKIAHTTRGSNVKPKNNTPRAPLKLPLQAKRFWESVVRDYALEPHHLELLSQAVHQLARSIQAREVLQKDGVTTTNRHKEIIAHPAVAIERSAALAFKGLCREMGLDVEPASALRGHARPGTYRS